MKFCSMIICLSLIAVAGLNADYDINVGPWEFAPETTELGLDVSVGGGYGIPLNLNDKPVKYDMTENYEVVPPTIFARAGLGAYRYEGKPELNGTVAVEYFRSAYESPDYDLAFNGFGVFNGFSAHPVKHLSIKQASSSGIYILSSDPDQTVTGSFADYTADVDARTGKPHLYSADEIGIGFAIGETPFMEISADARMETYYPRYVFWPEMARGLVYGAIEGGFNGAARGTDVWALSLIGPIVTTAMELFNLNLYPDHVGETHQHIFTPSLTLTMHF